MANHQFTEEELTLLSLSVSQLAESNETMDETVKTAVEKAKSGDASLELSHAERVALAGIVQTMTTMIDNETYDPNVHSAVLESLLNKLNT